MMNSAVAKRYGQALLQLAQENDKVDQYQEELQLAVETIEGNTELSHVWNGKEFDNETKIKVVKEVFAGKVSAHIVNLLCIVIGKGRESYLADILAMYKVYADEARNVAYAEVVSAFELTDEQNEAIKQALSQKTGKEIKLSVTVDKSLLGGMKVKFGDVVYDGSAIARLNGLRKSLLEV